MEIDPIIVGTTIAALIAGTISLLGLIITKESKISDFRQEWIDKFREELSGIIGHIGTLVTHIEINSGSNNKTDEEKVKIEEAIRPHLLEANTLVSRIKLRVTPKEHEVLLNEFDRLSEFIKKGDLSTSGFQEHEDALTLCGQKIFKEEWERVKKGEPAFRIAKCLATTLIGVGVVFIAVLAWNSAF